ncbi:hypothetical protein R0137_06940 [Congregibacter brevis]|uniref:PcRGLX/YetA-like N-terminal RIFT barrel domain-containing protein n=1 Tax=Congregibacter brevis TaxID=3081201 RepID=A0ABZ0IIH2_9GAMM|nr:hypothetical protein R0137_06940 [Congregibacter sp. IMCC45268]
MQNQLEDKNHSAPTLIVTERQSLQARRLNVRCGIPLPQGFCFDRQKLTLEHLDGISVPAYFDVSALWPDNSIQWCFLKTEIDLLEKEKLYLKVSNNHINAFSRPEEKAAERVEEKDSFLSYKADQREFRFDSQDLKVTLLDEEVTWQISLQYAGARHTAKIAAQNYRTDRTAWGELATEIDITGAFLLPDDRCVRVTLNLVLQSDGRKIDGSVTLHNPSAANHSNGRWDLGDCNSIFFDSLEFTFTSDVNQTKFNGWIKVQPHEEPKAFAESVRITQHASGGANWNSPVHVNHMGKLPSGESGFLLEVDECVHRGKRADPMLQLRLNKTLVTARINDFWQRYPSELSATADGLCLGLMPKLEQEHELQPGERCTKRFSLAFEKFEKAAATPETSTSVGEASVQLTPEHIRHCALPELGDESQVDPRLQPIIDRGLNGKDSFFAKREAIDEYGWRHFGDLWADHETEGYDGKRLFVSHYNNQYDPLFGLLRQYLITGDTRWFELANDLARHVRDIDVYHTQDDRPEYNHGLFWHTDHYSHAETSSHRSYSKLQTSDAYDGHTGGGGPGGQHCYTTGLLYHFLITGDSSSLSTLFGLREWIERVYEGSSTLFEVGLAIKNRSRPDLKNHLTDQYPLDRGVANYMNALMDCYTLSRSPATLLQLANIIRKTIHPKDDLDRRNLGNVEECWFYVVFLQAVTRFLSIKHQVSEFDEHFTYARDSLIAYADWIVINEKPYLLTPEILEFPNQTWNAQDLRKANVLYEAARWHRDNASDYIEKAKAIVDFAVDGLSEDKTKYYTRIGSLLMLNQHPTREYPEVQIPKCNRGHYSPPSQPNLAVQSLNIALMVIRALAQLSPKREVAYAKRVLGMRKPNGVKG